MNDNIQPMRRALAKSRALAKKETAKADNLSRHLAKLIKAEMTRNAITLKRLAEASKISMSQIVNWLCGSSTHCIPPDVVTTLYNAASKPTKPCSKNQAALSTGQYNLGCVRTPLAESSASHTSSQ